ncbi:MAG: M48 family metalloprotease [Verrucomicrobia bacterium]|nr:M48 family metalloprotease [Verrucomicrobiota bacterium]
MRCALPAVGLFLLLAGCASTDVAPHRNPTAALEDDERRLWARAREEQARLDASDFHVRLPQVEDYLDGIVARLRPDPLPNGGAFRTRVLVDPTLNAFAMPDGAIYVHTGLLAQAENEAQLATVLAHEIVHALHRHSLKGTRQVRNQTAILATLGAGTLGAGLAGSVVQLLGAVGTMASVTGYSRELEREADAVGFRLLTAAGYDARESTRMFEAMLAEADRAKHKSPYFFSTHPRLQERIASFEQLLSSLPPAASGTRTGRVELEAVLPPALALNAEATLRLGDFDSTIAQAKRFLTLQPGHPHLAFVQAEAHRKRGQPDDAATALQLLQALEQSHSQFAPAQRSLGLLSLAQGRKPDAARHFKRYLELEPAAADRGYILDFLRQCEP